MTERALKRRRVFYFFDVSWLIVSGLSMTIRYDLTEVFFWLWLFVFVVYAASLSVKLIFPELAVCNGQICFFRQKPGLWRYARLPMDQIAHVLESTRKVGGFAKMVAFPTFIFVMADGDKFEYFPNAKAGKRLEAVKSFLADVPGLPPVTPMAEETEK